MPTKFPGWPTRPAEVPPAGLTAAWPANPGTCAYARGGQVSHYTGDGINGVRGAKYRLHQFLATGSSSLTVDTSGPCDVLVVAGGGGGGGQSGGTGSGNGGGGGAVFIKTMFLAEGVYPVYVGAGNGGAGYSGTGPTPTAVNNSRLGNILCYGGGGGQPELGSPGPGGSGGRNGGAKMGGSLDAGASSLFDTALGFWCNDGASGGGAIGAGGVTSYITGVAVSYGAAGANASPNVPAVNTGSGGGGANPGRNAPGPNGAEGIVAVRYRIS